jgi:CDP-diacylglycerol--serine O-phosphatidyltransferase
MNLRCLVPNGITLSSMAAGVISIALSWNNEPLEAAWWILYGTLLDRMDGTVARALKATSSLGAAMDSFSDFVTFGLAPAFLAFAISGGGLHPLLLAPMMVYIMGCALRLARFGLAPEKRLFDGVPSTMAGGVFAVAMIVAIRHPTPAQGVWIPILLLVFGIAMNLPFLRYNKVGGGNSRFLRFLLLGLVAFGALQVLLRVLPELLLGITATMMVLGPLLTAWDQRGAKSSQE